MPWLGLLLWYRFDPWLRNFHMPWGQPKKKGEEEEKKKAKQSKMSAW